MPQPTRRTNEHLWRIIVAALCLLITLATIAESFRHGRLAAVPTVDNVVYMSQGATWLRAFERGGFFGVVNEYLSAPSHAPYSTLLAFIAYSLFGIHDWAVCAASILVPLVGLFFCLRLTRSVSPLPRAGILLLAALVPAWFCSIEIFRPDYMANLCTAIAAMRILFEPRLYRRAFGGARAAFTIGLVLGFALWCKPAIFPGTLFFCCLAYFCRTIQEVHVYKRSTWVEMVLLGLWLAAGTALVSGPHYVVAYERIYEYIRVQMFGERSHLWRSPLGWKEQAVFYLTGVGGKWLLGPMLWVLSAACGLGAVVALSKYPRAAVRRYWPWMVTFLGIYGLPAANWMKIIEFGAAMQFTLVFAGVASLAFLARLQKHERWRVPVATIAILALCAVSIATWRWTFKVETDAQALTHRPNYAEETEAAEAVYREVVRVANDLERTKRSDRVIVTIAGAPGTVHHTLFTLWSVRDKGTRHGDIQTVHIQREFDDAEFERRLSSCDIIVANNGHTGMTVDRRAPKGFNARMFDRLTHHAGWTIAATVDVKGTPTDAPGRFVVLKRSAP
jgi:hypothetical protein